MNTIKMLFAVLVCVLACSCATYEYDTPIYNGVAEYYNANGVVVSSEVQYRVIGGEQYVWHPIHRIWVGQRGYWYGRRFVQYPVGYRPRYYWRVRAR